MAINDNIILSQTLKTNERTPHLLQKLFTNVFLPIFTHECLSFSVYTLPNLDRKVPHYKFHLSYNSNILYFQSMYNLGR